MKKRKYFGLMVVAILLSSCASAPSVPEWIRKTPEPDAKYTYFVGSSSAKDSATALNDATSSLIAGIMQFMGVSISVTSSAEARASLDDYQAQITQTVKTESTGRLAGFEVAEKYIQKDPKTGQYTVHVLARYETKELLKEKTRIESLFNEKIDAVAIPEQKGDAAASDRRLLDAIRSYAEAMTAAGGSDIENAQIKLERNAKKASGLAATLKLIVPSSQGASISVGGQLPSFHASLVANKGGIEQGVSGAPLIITYPRRLASGRIGTSTTQSFTDQNGNAIFEVPAIDIAGNYRVTIQLDFASISDLFASLPSWALPYSDVVESDLSGIVAYIHYKVISAAKNIPTAIAVYGKNPANAGKIDLGIFVGSLKEPLIKEGFVILDAEAPEVGGNPDIAQLKAAAPPQAQRFALITLDLVSVSKDGDYFIATTSGSMSVFDLTGGNTLYSASKNAQGMGLSETEAIANALKALGGQTFAKDLLSALP
jgi:hypothetical protein